jgi:plastocyanin
MESTGRTRRARRGLAWVALALACVGCATTGSHVATPDKSKAGDAAAEKKKGGQAQAVLTFADGQFLPATLLVDPGTVVRIENKDRVYHNAFSLAANAPFDVGGIAPGKSASVHLDKPGVMKVYCEFHRLESATIVVAPAKSRTQSSHAAYGPQNKGIAIAGK